uniref:Replication restart protein PriA n=1 Tax=Thermosporothrix sp. COM3 TaxID=2490863 RepID=A0A455SS86_9CHLR|nr:primosomal protein N' [Thermosporothrix sp. COM3]
MLAAIVPSAARWTIEQPLLTYQVPVELEAALQPGQLVAAPYGERLVEGIVWELLDDSEGPVLDDEDEPEGVRAFELRPIHSLLDPEPVLLPHQRALAEWIAEYYVTPLALVAWMMLSPGLVRRSQFVLRLSNDLEPGETTDQASLRLRALLGLLQEEGAIEEKRLTKLLGPTQAQKLIREIRENPFIVREPSLSGPKVKPRMKRVVTLIARGEQLLEWREEREAKVRQALQQPASSLAPAGVSPWSKTGIAAGEALPKLDANTVAAQRQLAALDLLQQSINRNNPWTPYTLCQATGLTAGQLRSMEKEGIVKIEKIAIRRDPLLGQVIPPSSPLQLTDEQQAALNRILAAAARGEEGEVPTPILLHGITGSGKTEIYLQALASLVARGKRGIVLVPEIALTTQAVQRVAARFPGRIAIMHSELSTGERHEEWQRIRSGAVDIVIGSRSALFAPVPDLGIIIIDEEHEAAYKQSSTKPTYHAREAALRLGEILHIPVVLGSATPSVESFYRAEQGVYELVSLKGRIGATLPPVEIVDLRNELRAGHTSIISRRLQEELRTVLERKQQAILFLNRRGAASFVLCRDCGYVALCNRCDIPLTYHATEQILLCHYCGLQMNMLHFCPSCHSAGIRYFGLGTEKVQETIQRLFPEARLLRWDRDTARNRHAHAELLERFARRDADILIGTQMIAKGLDLPGVTLVGVVSADIALNVPDYSASERAFTLLTQVAGRAGRGSEPGTVIIQTFNPQHFCIETASRHDYHEFYAAEIEVRRRFAYPPFRQFAKFTYAHRKRSRCQHEALRLQAQITEWIRLLNMNDTDIVGPAPAFPERVKEKYRWQMLLRGPDLHRLLRVIDAPDWEIDIDPLSAM